MTIDELEEGKKMPSFRALRETITEFLMDREEAMPKEVREQAKLCMSGTIPGVQPWDDLVELVYSVRDDCGPIMKKIAAAVAWCFEEHNFSGKADRMGGLRPVFRRDAGIKAPKGSKWPAKSTDPDVDPKYAPEPEEPEEPDDVTKSSSQTK